MREIVVDVSREFMDIQEAMKALNVSYVTIYRMIKQDRLIAVKLGNRTLIPKTEIDRVGAIRERGNKKGDGNDD